MLQRGASLPINARQVAIKVADYYHIPIDRFYTSNDSECVNARRVAFTICREDLRLSYPQIGRLFRLDHTTVLLGVRLIRESPLHWHKILTDVRKLLSGDAANHCQACGQSLDKDRRLASLENALASLKAEMGGHSS